MLRVLTQTAAALQAPASLHAFESSECKGAAVQAMLPLYVNHHHSVTVLPGHHDCRITFGSPVKGVIAYALVLQA